MNSSISVLILLVQIITSTCIENIDESSAISVSQQPRDLQRLTDMIINLEHRIEYTETLKENNKQLKALELHVIQAQNSLNSMNTQIAVIEQKLEKLTNSYDSAGRRSILPVNCKDAQKKGEMISGMYLIQPEYSPKAFMVFCDMETRGGGWTYFFNRFDGSQNFNLNWTDYKQGFGGLSGEFWLGLEALHQLTGYKSNELLVELSDFDGKNVYALYNAFVIGSEEEGYPVKVLGSYSGNAGDSLRYHAGMKFTTQDRDQDLRVTGNCADHEKGSWWYNQCTNSNLCAQYLKGEVSAQHRFHIMYWKEFRGSSYSLKEARMMVRPRSIYSSSVLRNN